MIGLTQVGHLRLREFIFQYAMDRVREAYYHHGKYAWLSAIADDGHLELGAQYAADGKPHTIRFKGEEVQS